MISFFIVRFSRVSVTREGRSPGYVDRPKDISIPRAGAGRRRRPAPARGMEKAAGGFRIQGRPGNAGCPPSLGELLGLRPERLLTRCAEQNYAPELLRKAAKSVDYAHARVGPRLQARWSHYKPETDRIGRVVYNAAVPCLNPAANPPSIRLCMHRSDQWRELFDFLGGILLELDLDGHFRSTGFRMRHWLADLDDTENLAVSSPLPQSSPKKTMNRYCTS